MLWDPFLIKKLLKSVICGIVNSTHMHCSQLTKSTIAGWKKKKNGGKRGEVNVDVQTKRSHQDYYQVSLILAIRLFKINLNPNLTLFKI